MSAVQKQSGKAAFEIKKGIRQVMTLSETDVEKYLDLQELLDGLEDGFRGLELGEIQSPPRLKCQLPAGASPLRCQLGVLACRSQSKSSTSSTAI